MPLDHVLHFVNAVPTACVLHAVGCDDKKRMLGNILLAGIFMDIPDVLNRIADSIKKRGAAAGNIILFGHGSDGFNVCAIVDDFAYIVEKNCRNKSIALLPLLLAEH